MFRIAAYSEETTLIEGAETKLITPLVFEESLPDDFDGTPGVRRSSAELSNINLDKAPAPRQLLGLTATGELWEVETETLVKRQIRDDHRDFRRSRTVAAYYRAERGGSITSADSSPSGEGRLSQRGFYRT